MAGSTNSDGCRCGGLLVGRLGRFVEGRGACDGGLCVVSFWLGRVEGVGRVVEV